MWSNLGLILVLWIKQSSLLWESAHGYMTTRRLIIQWSQKTFIIDIIISRKLLWDQRPQSIRILHEWNTKTTLQQSKRLLDPELLTYSREDRLPNCLIQITRIDQTLHNWIQSGPIYYNGLTLIPAWISYHVRVISLILRAVVGCRMSTTIWLHAMGVKDGSIRCVLGWMSLLCLIHGCAGNV